MNGETSSSSLGSRTKPLRAKPAIGLDLIKGIRVVTTLGCK